MGLKDRALDGPVNQVRAFLPSYQDLLAFQHQIMDQTRHFAFAASMLEGWQT